jgi:signal transduction histidine kinase
MTTRGLLRAAGLLIWGFAGIPAVTGIVRDDTCSTVRGALAVLTWAAAFVVFGLVFFRATRASAGDARRITRLVALQAACALIMNFALCTGFEAALLVVVSVQLGLSVPLRRAVVWILAQTVALFFLATMHMGAHRSIYWAIAVVGAEAFAFTVAAMAEREASARQALEKTNAELEATREELARASRDGERVRIAREMHDLLGHDMIALHLELEAAHHLTDGRARESVDRAREIGKTLLADLRNAVSSMRTDAPPVDVAAGLRALVEKVQQPRIHLEAPPSLDLGDAERATTVIRCAQEILTNAIKHAAADNLWLTLTENDGRIELRARDDGRGTATLEPGNGLGGMRERMTALGGELVLDTQDGKGFSICAVLPKAAAAS